MKYLLNVYSIWEIGKRKNQEDSIFPPYGKENDSDRLFLLCDGMGGHDAGEVASMTVCETVGHFILEKMRDDQEGMFTDEILYDAVDAAFRMLDIKDTGSEKKMGTTMTLLKFHRDGCTIAHIGDSRVYHIRPGRDMQSTHILFRTEDHSLVNDLVKIGELKAEDIKKSKYKNVITRAVQPHMEHRPKIDVYHTSDICPGDYFYMCSDGMLEEMEDENIRFTFSKKISSDVDKINILKKATVENQDNHSAIVVRVVDVIGSRNEQLSENNSCVGGNKKTKNLLLILVVLLILACLSLILWLI